MNNKIQYEQGQVIIPDIEVQGSKPLAIYAEIPLKVVEKDKERNEINTEPIFFPENKLRSLELQPSTEVLDVIALESGESLYPILKKL